MSKANILIVEDELIIAEDFKEVLQKLDYNILDIIPSGEEVIQKINELSPDIILMDITLDGKLNGVETSQEINKNHDIPIIYITAYSNLNHIRKSGIMESYGFLTKPVKNNELEATLEIALHKHKMKKRFESLYDNNPVATYTWKKDKNDFILIDFNQAAKELYNPSEGQDIDGIKARIFYENTPEMLQYMKKCYNDRTQLKREVTILNKKNPSKPSNAFFITFTFISPDFVNVNKEDITVIKNLEQKLSEITKEENQISKEKRQYNTIEEKLEGLPISPGVAIGEAYLIGVTENYSNKIPKYPIKDKEIVKEIIRLNKALNNTQQELMEMEKTTKTEIGEAESKIFLAMNMILNDEDFKDKIIKGIKYNKQNAESIVKSVIEYYVYKFSNVKNTYIRERANDIEELGDKILANLQPKITIKDSSDDDINRKYILIANKLTPQITSTLNKESISGIVTEHGSYSSHAGILSRGMSIPAVSGIYNLMEKVNFNTKIIVDGNNGNIIINPTEDTIENYTKIKKVKKLNYKASINNDNIINTKDGRKIELLTNISGINDISYIENTKHNIGLFRTEFVYLNSIKEPSEKEQYEIYKKIMEKFGSSREITFRTLDIGDDKIPSYMKKEKCDNPALGLRGIRMLLKNKDMLINQIRAILKVSSMGRIKIMFPMINSIKEVIEAKSIIERERHSLLAKGYTISDKIKIGIMVETPASLLSLNTFINHIDFVSVGTNDLTQYLLATDRNNENVSKYYDNYHPSIVKSLLMISEFSNKNNIPTTLCGELNTDFKFLPYLIGMGFEKFSVNPIFLNNISKFISNIKFHDCENRLYKDYGEL